MSSSSTAFDLQSLLADAAADLPDSAALIAGDSELSFAELDGHARSVAGALREAGVGPDDRVAYLGKNCAEYLELLFGSTWLGAVPVAVNWRLALPEVIEVLRDSMARVVVLAPEFAELLPALSAALEPCPDILIVPGVEAAVDVDPRRNYHRWRDAAEPAGASRPVAPDDTAMQIYTSGTTGRPKGVMLSYANMAAAIPGAAQAWQLDADSVILSVLPWFHIAGIGPVLGALWSRSATVLTNDSRPEEIVKQLDRHRVSTVVVVSSLLQRILECPSLAQADLSALRVVAYGAAPISQSVLRSALSALTCDLLQVYGLTEAVGTIAYLPPRDHDLSRPTTARRLQSCGRPPTDIELRLVDPATGADVPVGGIGEIWVRSPRTMTGYWRNPAATDEVVTPDGWLRTGDLAGQDDAGYLYLKDRFKDMIVSGGENVYPAEIENVLAACPAVEEVTVVGVPSARWGESPRAIVVLRPGYSAADATEQQIVDFARARLAHYKCPGNVEFVAVLPRNASGKVLKHVIREKYWQGLDRRVN